MRTLFFLFLSLFSLSCAHSLEPEEGMLTTEPGVEIHWRAIGEGPALIVPGGFLFGEDLDRFARSHRLILYDMRNRGRSSAIEDPELLTIEGDVRDLEALRRHLGIESFSAVGYSYLGKMIVLYALEHPARIDRLIQIGPVPMRFDSRIPPVWDNSSEEVMDPEALARLRSLRAGGLHEERPAEYCEEEWRVGRVRLVGDPALAHRLESPCSMSNEWPTNFAVHLRHHFPSAQRANVSPLDLAGFDTPVLTVHGTKDRNAPYGGGREWAAMLPNGRLRTVEGGAHQAWVDDPPVLDDIGTFLGGTWPESAAEVEIAREQWLSQLRGVELLERSARSYRMNDEALDAEAATLRLEGNIFSRSQSRTPGPPWDPFPVAEELLFAANGTDLVAEEEFHWPNFVSRYRMVSRPGEGFELNINSRTIVEPSTSSREAWIRRLMAAPVYLAEQILEDPGAVRLLGVVELDGEAHQLIEGNLEDQRLRLEIDREDRIRRVSRLTYDAMTGDSLEVTELAGDQGIGDLIFPERLRRSLNGHRTSDLEILPGAEPDHSRFRIPEGFEQATSDRARLSLDEIAPDVWIARNIGGSDYRSLVVVHDDGLVIVEAPVEAAAMAEVLELLRIRFPDVPIKAAVVTHHHYDHSGGIRPLMEAGARIYVPRGTEELFRQVGTVPRTLMEGSASIDRWTLRIEGVEHAVIEPNERGPVVQIHELGENDHADGMLFAWLPEPKILFQGDLYVKRGAEPEPARAQGVIFLRRIEELGLEPEMLGGVHGEIATMEDLVRAVELTER